MFRIDSMTQPIPNELSDQAQSAPSSLSLNRKRLSSVKDVLDLWSGITPALLLCSNPAINFTIYDVVKDYVLSYKRNYKTGIDGSTSSIDNINIDKKITRINMMEAFCIGLIAKFAATMVTYPLIRAKVMLMVAKKAQINGLDTNKTTSFAKNNSCKNVNVKNCHSNRSTKKDKMKSKLKDTTQNSMFQILYKIYINEGIQGLYKGCGLQLIHTILKSALLMMVRERITIMTRRLIVG